jgi:rod shape determining protein RodA
MASGRLLRRQPEMPLGRKLLEINWGLVLLLSLLAGVGCVMLYSAAGGSIEPWAERQALRFGFALGLLIVVALIDIRFWFRLAYPIYVVAVLMLVAVDIMGATRMGAERWIDLGFIQLQPSEVMKVALILALARYFHGVAPEDIGRPTMMVVPILMAAVPAALVLVQPDLGTAAMLLAAGGAMLFLAGMRLWMFAVILVIVAAAVPIGWEFLHDYQRQRVLTFLNPENDPLGSGYHILQSLIALGAGGIWGRGFLMGTQGHLNFVPEKQTDFIFAMLAEEFGLVGSVALLCLYLLVLAYGFAIALRARNHFARLLSLGVTINLFLYVAINVSMVIGVIPVVGIPLPLISYGGTVMLSLMVSYGLMMSAYVHRDQRISRRGLSEEG